MAPFKSGGYNKDDRKPGFSRGGDRPSFGNRGFSRGGGGRDRDTRPPQMFSATCAECQKVCEVPLRPTGDKRLYCPDCFSNKRGSPQGDFNRSSSSRPAHDFPKRDRDFSRSPSFDRKPAVADKRIDELKIQVETISKKLDALTEMVRGFAITSSPKVAKAKPDSEKPTKKAIKKVAKAKK